MAPWPLTRDGILGAAESALAGGRVPVGARAPEGWDGKAGERIVAALEEGSKGESLSLRLLLGLVRGQFPIAP